MRGLKITVNPEGNYSFEFQGQSIRDIMYRINETPAQKAFTLVLNELNLNSPFDYVKIAEITESLENTIGETPMERGFTEKEAWIRIFLPEEEKFKKALKDYEDLVLLNRRFNVEKVFEYKDYDFAGFLDKEVPFKDFTYDVINQLETKDGMAYFDGEVMIARSFEVETKMDCFCNLLQKEKIMVFIQIIMNGTATGLQDTNARSLKKFVESQMDEFTVPFSSFAYWKTGATMLDELTEAKMDDMNSQLQEAGILNDLVKVKNAYLMMPNFVTEAVEKKKVKFEFGLQIHITANKEDFEFFIEN